MPKPNLNEVYIYKGNEYVYTKACDDLQELPYVDLYVEKDGEIITIPNGNYTKKSKADLEKELFKLTKWYWLVTPINVIENNRVITLKYNFKRYLNLVNIEGTAYQKYVPYTKKYTLAIKYKDTENEGDILMSYSSDTSLEEIIKEALNYLIYLYKEDLKTLQ